MISDDKLQQLIGQLRGLKQVGKAWLAQKQVAHQPDSPVYILAFKPKGLRFSKQRLQQEVADSLNMDEDLFIVCKHGDNAKLAGKVIKAGRRIL